MIEKSDSYKPFKDFCKVCQRMTQHWPGSLTCREHCDFPKRFCLLERVALGLIKLRSPKRVKKAKPLPPVIYSPIPVPPPRGSVSAMRLHHKGSELIGGRLFINGTPYEECHICGLLDKQFEGNSHITKDRRAFYGTKREIKVYKVTLGRWEDYYEEGVDQWGTQVMERKWRPIVREVRSCFLCWQALEDARERERRHPTGKGGLERFLFYQGTEGSYSIK